MKPTTLLLLCLAAFSAFYPPTATAEDPAMKQLELLPEAQGSFDLGAFIRDRMKEGLKGKDLADAIRQERERLGLPPLSAADVQTVRQIERKTSRILFLDRRIDALKASAGSGTFGDSRVKSDVQDSINKMERERSALRKDVEELLSEIGPEAPPAPGQPMVR